MLILDDVLSTYDKTASEETNKASIRALLVPLLDKINLDMKGHFFHLMENKTVKDMESEYKYAYQLYQRDFVDFFTNRLTRKMGQYYNGDIGLVELVRLLDTLDEKYSSILTCTGCGELVNFPVATRPCTVTERVPELVLPLKVTSGKVIALNFVNPYISTFTQEIKQAFEGRVSIQSHQQGVIDYINYFSSRNMLYLPTILSPSIYHSKDQSICKLTLFYEGEDDVRPSDLTEDFKKLGGVTTDVWAVTLLDYGEFLNQADNLKKGKIELDNYVLIDLPNGDYKCTYTLLPESEEYHPIDTCLATIERLSTE